MDYTDEQLVEAHLAGDIEALPELVDRHSKTVYRIAFRLVGAADADDVTQETFVKAWKNLRSFDQAARFRPWLLSIARNAAIDRLRKRHPIAFSSLNTDDELFQETIADDAPLPDELLSRADLEQRLERALEQLSPQYKTVVLLHDMEELTFEEIAATVGMPMNTVKSQYRRALQRLRLLLAADQGH